MHDYRRHGTTSLFAALDYPRHRAVGSRKFRNVVGATVPPGLKIHLVLENYGKHKAATTHSWLHLHFAPTSASWIDRVERWFADLTECQIRGRRIAAHGNWRQRLKSV